VNIREAVIVDAVRTPVGRRVACSASGIPPTCSVGPCATCSTGPESIPQRSTT